MEPHQEVLFPARQSCQLTYFAFSSWSSIAVFLRDIRDVVLVWVSRIARPRCSITPAAQTESTLSPSLLARGCLGEVERKLAIEIRSPPTMIHDTVLYVHRAYLITCKLRWTALFHRDWPGIECLCHKISFYLFFPKASPGKGHRVAQQSVDHPFQPLDIPKQRHGQCVGVEARFSCSG